MDENRTCYSCDHLWFCFLYRVVREATEDNNNMLNVETDATAQSYEILFTGLANCCRKYKNLIKENK